MITGNEDPRTAAAPDHQGLEKANVIARDLWRVVSTRRWIVLACVFGIVTLSMTRVLLAPPRYTAAATLVIQQTAPDILTFKDVVDNSAGRIYYQEFLETQLGIIKSEAVLTGAAEELDLFGRPEYVTREPPTWRRIAKSVRGFFTTETSSEESTDDAKTAIGIAFIKNGLTVNPRYSSQFVQLSFVDRHPELARDAANAVAEAFVAFTIASRSEITSQANTFLSDQVMRLQEEIEDDEADLRELTREKEIVTLGEGATDITEQTLADLNLRVGAARAGLALARAREESVGQSEPDAHTEVQNSSLVSDLRRKYADLEREYGQMAERFKKDWPPLAQLGNELEQTGEQLRLAIEHIAGQVRSSAQAERLEAAAEFRNLEAELGREKMRAQTIIRETSEYRNLVAQIEGKRSIRNELFTRQSETAASQELKTVRASNVRIIDGASLPKHPSGPRPFTWLMWSLLLGTAAGIGAALVIDHLDNSVKHEDDIERASQLATLGRIPRFPSVRLVSGRSPGEEPLLDLASHTMPQTVFAEAFKTLRTSVLLAHPEHPPRHVVITSALPEEGKSLICTNLAIALSGLGKRVLVIDADLRRARLHRVFDLDNATGLSSLLSGNASLSEVVQETEVPNLLVIPSGPLPPNPSELLGSPALADLLASIEKEEAVDHVIVDSPPVLSLSDAMILTTVMDATIVVVRSGRTSREILRHSVAQLRKSRGHIIGAVLNSAAPQSSRYYYGRYYGPSRRTKGQSGTRSSKWPVRLVVRPPSLSRNRTEKRRQV